MARKADSRPLNGGSAVHLASSAATAAASQCVMDLEISDLQFLILSLIRDSEKPLHGYALYREAEKRNNQIGVFAHVGQSSVYKSLENLLRRELVAPGLVTMGATGHPAREFILTEKGQEAIRCQRSRLEVLATL